MSEDASRPRRRRPRPVVRRRRTWLDYFPLFSLVAFLVAVVVVTVAAFNWLAPAGRPVTVPQFIGMTYGDAESLASSAHVGLRVVAHRSDYHASRGAILGQLPGAGEKVREGRVIDVVTSDGVPTVKIPNLSNLSLRDARVALENAHLQLGAVSESINYNVVEGQVLEQHPDPFTSVPAGSSVNVMVASGRPQMYAPSFVGMSVDFAKKAAGDAHVPLGTITEMPLALGAKPKGIVVAQDPPAGLALTPKQRISLEVSGGSPATPTPSPLESPVAVAPSPSPSPSASPILPSPGAARAMRISVALPQTDQAKPVRVVLQDATGSKTIFDQTTSGGITLSFDVTVVGQGTIETYVDGKLVSSTPL